MQNLTYNSERPHLTIPEYGRHIQNLVEYAISIENQEERMEAAKQIVVLMAQVSNHGKMTPDIEAKLWRHLFIISDYKIAVIPEGIDLPSRETREMKPARISYPKNTKRYRHYGAYVQELIDKALEEKDPDKRKEFFSIIASYMKTAYKVWNRDQHIGDENIITDLESIIGGRGELPEELNIKAAQVKLPKQGRDNSGSKRGRRKSSNHHKGGSNNRRRRRR